MLSVSVFAACRLGTCPTWADKLRRVQVECCKQWAAHLLDDGLKQGCQVIRQLFRVSPGDAVDAAGIHHGEVALLIGGAQLAEEVECRVNHKVWSAKMLFFY